MLEIDWQKRTMQRSHCKDARRLEGFMIIFWGIQISKNFAKVGRAIRRNFVGWLLPGDDHSEHELFISRRTHQELE